MRKRVGNLVVFLFVMLSISSVLAAEFDTSISNSENWEDVYSTMLLSALEGVDSEFLVGTAHGPILADGLSKNREVFVVSSRSDPFVFNYESTLNARGFNSVEEVFVTSANLELLDELPDVNNFIVVGNDFGHNAIAVVQYAKRTNSWVFLADRVNIDEIDQILTGRNVNDILLYGYVDREVRDTLDKYNPEVINTGDKFLDNIEIFKKYESIGGDTRQIVLTNGEFIEKEIMLGTSAILFTGRENVPDQIRDYLKTSNVQIGVLIGNELINAATNIKRTAGIDVIAKFARGARGQAQGAVALVEGLDLFYLPSGRISLKIFSIKYNRATQVLEVTYESDSNVPAYFKGTIEVVSNGDTTRVGDIDPIFISPGDYKTIGYEDLENIDENDIVADVYTLYGEVDTALDRILEGRYEVDVVNVIDSCQIEPSALIYNKQKSNFFVKVKNTGSEDCYVSVEMRDVLINDFETTIGSEEPVLVRSGRSAKIYVDQEMDVEDLKDNSVISVYGYYGQRRESLTSEFRANLEVSVQTLTFITWIIIILIILIIILIILAIWYKRREDSF